MTYLKVSVTASIGTQARHRRRPLQFWPKKLPFRRTGYRLRDFLEIVGLSISVSLAATAIAAGVSLPIGAALAIFPFRGRRLVVGSQSRRGRQPRKG